MHCRLNPADMCLSCYSKQLGGEQRFTYDQTGLGRFHREYQAMMDHWRKKLSANCLIEVGYATVADDLEGQAKHLIDFIDLPWDAACQNFHKTQHVARTVSVNQARKSIYRTAKGRWRIHAVQLGPLLTALAIKP